MNTIAETYLELFDREPQAQLALLSCCAALRLDDLIAVRAIELVAGSNGSTASLVHRMKNLCCVWTDADGSWGIAEDVRRPLQKALRTKTDEAIYAKLRSMLAAYATERAEALGQDGQITECHVRQAKLEAAFQGMFIAADSAAAAKQLGKLWMTSSQPAKRATARAVDYLAQELPQGGVTQQIELLFLRGMAAHDRRDRRGQERYFGPVWEHGRKHPNNVGQLHAIAAHLYGRALGRSDAARAEHALRDSIAWRTDPAHRGQVWHSLGNLLSKDRERWSDAEKAYKKSLGLDADPVSQGQTWHSMGNLLSKDHKRWPEAEDAYQKSLDLRTDPTDQGQTHASWAEMLRFSDDERRLLDAETHARAAAQLMHWHVPTMGRTHRILADVYEKLERYADAIASLENLMRTDAQLGTTKYEVQIKRRIEGLKRRLKQSTE